MTEEMYKKLQEVSVSVPIIHYWAVKGTGYALNKSLSRVIREAVHDLLEREVWGHDAVYRHMLIEAGFFTPKGGRDIDELEETMGIRAHSLPPELIDRMLDGIEKMMALDPSLTEETQESETPSVPVIPAVTREEI